EDGFGHLRGVACISDFLANSGHPLPRDGAQGHACTAREVFLQLYLKGCDNILAQLHTAHPEFCDKFGGILAMHIDDLRALAPLWLSKIEEVRQDKSNWSTNITGDIYGMGWISEMYGYSFGAAEVGLWHKINDDIMIYPGYTPRPGIEPLILHYGLPFKVGNWPFSKLEHHEDGIIYDCNHLFDPPPFPREKATVLVMEARCVNWLVENNKRCQ
ncbi:hypothetical protein ACJX0J_034558, partial [Zea mays]